MNVRAGSGIAQRMCSLASSATPEPRWTSGGQFMDKCRTRSRFRLVLADVFGDDGGSYSDRHPTIIAQHGTTVNGVR